jgi:RNA polymerase sigma factor (sigma-70 family)
VPPSFLNAPNAFLLADRMEQGDSAPLRGLTTGLARGDDVAWAEFHREYGPGLFRHLLAATRGDYDLASDALQQAYLRVARHARACDSPQMFSAWLQLVARSALNDCRRRRLSFWKLLQRRTSEPDPVSNASAEEDRLFALLDAALAAIDPDDRALLEAKYFSGSDVRSLADKLALSPKAVESRLTRARADLRRHLAAMLARHE